MLENINSKDYKIIGIIIISAIFLYMLHKYLRKKAKEYYSKDYWEKRYGFFNQTMDWYTNFEEIDSKFKIMDILNVNYQNKSKCKILEMGCGDSTLSYDLHNKGFTQITAIDFSHIVIEKMKAKYSEANINYLCMDFNEINEKFEKENFDIIIEKAGLDSIATKQSNDVPQILYEIYKKMHFVLKKNGIVLSVSSKNPTFWKNTVLMKLVEEKIFDIVQIKRSTFSTIKNSQIMNMYFYYLRKI